MKIVFDANAVKYPLTGIGRYTYELGSRLPAHIGSDNVQYYRSGALHRTLPDRPATSSNMQALESKLGLRKLATLIPILSTVYHGVNALQQRQVLTRLAGEKPVFHGPNFYLPEYSGPCVATFHDLSIYMWPDCHPVARVRHMSRELPVAIQRAQVLVTDSEFTRREVAQFFGFPIDKIVAAPLAASSEFHPRSAAEADPVMKKFGLNYGAYSLFVGTLDPRKNIDLLLDVYERMPDKIRQRFPLIVVGFEGWKSAETLVRLKVAEQAGWARYLNFVDESALPSLYSAARVFLFPSRYEGFGLPILEAMASGVPVICSDAASLPEVAGKTGARLIPVDDIDQFYQAVLMSLEDDQWFEEMRLNGLERAKVFTWEETTKLSMHAYRLAEK